MLILLPCSVVLECVFNARCRCYVWSLNMPTLLIRSTVTTKKDQNLLLIRRLVPVRVRHCVREHGLLKCSIREHSQP